MIRDVLLLFFFKHLQDFIPSGSNLPGSECYWKFPMHFYPFALSLRGISIHFFSLSWAIENTVGARRPLQTKKYFFGGKKCKIVLVIGWQTWSEVILKLCGIGWGAETEASKMKKNGILWKPAFVSLLSGTDSIILGVLGITRVPEPKRLQR